MTVTSSYKVSASDCDNTTTESNDMSPKPETLTCLEHGVSVVVFLSGN